MKSMEKVKQLNLSDKIQADLSNLKIIDKIPVNNFKINETLSNLEMPIFENNSSKNKSQKKSKNNISTNNRITNDNNNLNFSQNEILNFTEIKEKIDSPNYSNNASNVMNLSDQNMQNYIKLIDLHFPNKNDSDINSLNISNKLNNNFDTIDKNVD